MRVSALFVAILATLAGSAVSFAEPVKKGPYMSAFIGGSIINDAYLTSERYSIPNIYNDKVEFDPGIHTGLTGGYNFGYFRLEGELSYKGGSISDITDRFDNYRYHNVDGDIGIIATMMNGFFDLRNNSPFTPYVGGGIGCATVYLSDTYATNTRGGIPTRDLLYLEDAASTFAYQVGGGLEIALNSVLSLDLSYRYLVTSKAKFEDDWDGRTEFSLKSHNAAVGFRVKF